MRPSSSTSRWFRPTTTGGSCGARLSAVRRTRLRRTRLPAAALHRARISEPERPEYREPEYREPELPTSPTTATTTSPTTRSRTIPRPNTPICRSTSQAGYRDRIRRARISPPRRGTARIRRAHTRPGPPRATHSGEWEGGEWTGSHRAITTGRRGVSCRRDRRAGRRRRGGGAASSCGASSVTRFPTGPASPPRGASTARKP